MDPRRGEVIPLDKHKVDSHGFSDDAGKIQ